jgi:hypothetical protein
MGESRGDNTFRVCVSTRGRVLSPIAKWQLEIYFRSNDVFQSMYS